MGNELEALWNSLGLSSLARQYRDIEVNFWNIILAQIKRFFPEDFNFEVLKLDDVLANIIINANMWDGGVHSIQINSQNFSGNMSELYEKIKYLNGLKLDEFYIEIEWFNFRHDKKPTFHVEETEDHIIRFRVKRESKIIDSEVIWASNNVVKILEHN